MSGFNKTRKKSFTEQKKEHGKIRTALLFFLSFLLLYLFLTNMVFLFHSIKTQSMNPGIIKGDYIIFSSFEFHKLFPQISFFNNLPVKRGDIALIDFSEERPFFEKVLTILSRFFTAGRIALKDEGSRVFIKRIIALPGDEISITNYVARVRPAGSTYIYTEYECSEKLYYNNIPESNALWDESVPFSGGLETITLKEGECFVLSDDRSNTNDSRTWGALPLSKISGKAIIKYWPFTRLGTL